METNIIELNDFELIEIEAGCISLFTISVCAIAYAAGLATALMIL